MKMHRSWIVIALLVSALVLGACNPLKVAEQIGQGQPDQPAQPAAQQPQSAPQPTATPVPQQPTATPQPAAEAETEDEDTGPVYDLEEAGISSYRQQIINETLLGEETSTTTILIEYTAEGPATRMVVTGDDEGDAFESIRIGDITYMRGADDEWITMQVVGEDVVGDMLGVLGWADPDNVLGNEGCDLKGRETIAGQQTRHYHCDQTPFLGQQFWAEGANAKLEEAYMDYYVSTEFNVAIKSVVFWKGASDDGPFSYRFEALVTDINGPIVIEAPAGVAAPGVDDDIPVPDNATQVTAMSNMINFTVPEAASEIVTWYKDEMSARGWALDESTSLEMGDMSIQNWGKDNRTANIMISADGEDKTNVVISVVAE